MSINNKVLYSIIAVAFVGGLFTAVYAGPIMPMITLAGDVTITGDMTCPGCVDSADIADGTITEFDLGTDSVGADEIKTASVGFIELAANAVRTGDILDETIQSRDIKDGTITADDLAQGSVGDSLTIYKNTNGVNGNIAGASCDTGDTVLGGGGIVIGVPIGTIPITASGPSDNPANSWAVHTAPFPNDKELFVTVICADTAAPFR